MGGGTFRATRTLEGKAEVVGVAGRTLTEEFGDRVDFRLMAEELTELELEEVDEALEWE